MALAASPLKVVNQKVFQELETRDKLKTEATICFGLMT